ncbi:hypothetical protein JCM13304A_01740 [Desulfothermus okinawensis JCM 13304]
MVIGISAIIIFLISFWVLGYMYQQNSSQMSVKERRLRESINSIKIKMQALEREKSIYQKKIETIDRDIKELEEQIKDLEEREILV